MTVAPFAIGPVGVGSAAIPSVGLTAVGMPSVGPIAVAPVAIAVGGPLAVAGAAGSAALLAPPVSFPTRGELADWLRTRIPRSPRALLTTAALLGAAAVVGALLVTEVSRARPALAAVPTSRATVPWLTATAALAGSMYLCNAVQLRAASGLDYPLGRGFAGQLAAAFGNRVLPAGLGAIGVNIRFLVREGLPRPAAVTALAVTKIVGVLVHLALLAAAISIGAAAGSRLRMPVPSGWWIAGFGAAAAVVVVTAAGCHGPIGRHLAGPVRLAGAQLGRLLCRPRAATCLLTTATLGKLSHIAALATALAAFGIHVPPATVAAVYLAGSSVAAAVPAPGGVGPIEAALVAGLVAEGAPASPALAAVLAFRLITTWLPVVPGGVSFFALRRRGAL